MAQKMVNATVCIPKNRGCKKTRKMWHLPSNPQFLQISSIFAWGKFVQIHFFVLWSIAKLTGKLCVRLKCRSIVNNVFAFSPAPFSIHMSWYLKLSRSPLYLYLCLTSGSCLLKQQMKSIIAEPTRILTTSHYLFNHQGTCYCLVICRPYENEYFVSLRTYWSYLFCPCCTRYIHLSIAVIHLSIHLPNPPRHRS